MNKLTKLFESLKVGSLDLKNRIVMTGYAITSEEDTAYIGVMHRKYIDFFEERARSGVGMIILPDTAVDSNLRFQSHPCIGSDEYNPGLSALTEAVHMWGSKIVPDLHHAGSRFEPDFHSYHPYGRDYRPLSSSAVSLWGAKPREMNTEEIEQVIELYVNAAVRAKSIGFDAVQLAGSYGYLIAQFLSPLFNKRNDKYGGSLENRAKFPVEIVTKIKAQIGDSIPFIFRMSADEFVEGGLRIEETKIIAKYLQDAGVDMLNIVAGLEAKGKYHLCLPPMGSPQGYIIELGAQIKQVVDIPVMIVGRITDPIFAERMLEEGKADLRGMARQLAADPEWPQKAAEGRFSDIVPCIGCNECIRQLLEHTVSRCSVNAAMGREKTFKITPALESKKVIVIGGGPAGMEAARIAALRGHDVSLYEKTDTLGGQLLLASKPPYKNEIKQFLDYLISQIDKLGVKVNLGIEVIPDIIEHEEPDVAVLATGGIPYIPQIQGIDLGHVTTAWDVLQGAEIGDNVTIVGGGSVGCEVAEYLIEQGKTVSVIEMLPEIALDVEASTRSFMMERFSGYDLNIKVNSRVVEIVKEGLVIVQDGQKRVLGADTVIIAMGTVPNAGLSKELRSRINTIHVIGDCFKPGMIVDAINHASFIARQI